MSKNINLTLTVTEFQQILESLLFHCSVDCSSSIDKTLCEDLKNLAIKLRKNNPEILTKNCYFFKDEQENYHDKFTIELLEFFPETIIEKFQTDNTF